MYIYTLQLFALLLYSVSKMCSVRPMYNLISQFYAVTLGLVNLAMGSGMYQASFN